MRSSKAGHSKAQRRTLAIQECKYRAGTLIFVAGIP
jgi:hypothetical protein